MTLEPERDNPNDIRTNLAQHVQVAHKMAPSLLIGPILMPYRTQNRIFCVESSSSEETPNTPLLYRFSDKGVDGYILRFN